MSDGRTIVDRLISRFQSVGARQVITETNQVAAAQRKLVSINSREAKAASEMLAAEAELLKARTAAVKAIDSESAAAAAQTINLQQVANALSAVATMSLRLERAEGALERQQKSLAKTSREQGDALKALRSSLTEINSGFELGKKAIGVFKGALQSVAGRPAALATDFETGLAKIRTLGVDTSKGLEQDLLNLARRVPQTAGDITAATFDAISAQPNRSLKEIVQLLDSASKVATGGSITLTEAVNALTASTNAYQTQGLDAARAADILFATMKQGVFTIADLQKAQGSSLGVANALRVSYEEVGATVAALTAGGIPSAAEAFTRLDAVMNLLSKPTEQQQKAFDELGISVGVSALKASGFTGKLREIQRVTGGSAEALAALTGRNKEAFQAISILLNDGLLKYSDALQKITTDTGTASAAFGQLDDTVAGQLARLSAEFEGLLIQVGKSLLPVIRDAVRSLQDAISGERGRALVETLKTVAITLFQIAKGAAQAALAVSKAFSESTVGRVLRMTSGINDAVSQMLRLRRETERALGPTGSFNNAIEEMSRSVEEVAGYLDEPAAMMRKVQDATIAATAALSGIPGAAGAVARSVEQIRAERLKELEAASRAAVSTLSGLPPLAFDSAAAVAWLGQQVEPTTLAMRAFVTESVRALTALTGFPGVGAAAAAAISQTINAVRALRRGRGKGTRERVSVVIGIDETSLAEGRAAFDRFLTDLNAMAARASSGLLKAITPLASDMRRIFAPIEVAGRALIDGIASLRSPLESELVQIFAGLDAQVSSLAMTLGLPMEAMTRATRHALEEIARTNPELAAEYARMAEASSAAIQSTASALDSLTSGISQGLAAALIDAAVFGASFEQLLNQLANAVARQALIQVPLEIGYAIADQAKFLSTGLPNFQAAAAAHLAAAKTFALIGGGALIAAAATGGIGGSKASGRDTSRDVGGSPSQRDLGPRAGGGSGSVSNSSTVIVQNYGPVLATRREQEAQAFALVNRTSTRRGAPRIRQGVIRRRS